MTVIIRALPSGDLVCSTCSIANAWPDKPAFDMPGMVEHLRQHRRDGDYVPAELLPE